MSIVILGKIDIELWGKIYHGVWFYLALILFIKCFIDRWNDSTKE